MRLIPRFLRRSSFEQRQRDRQVRAVVVAMVNDFVPSNPPDLSNWDHKDLEIATEQLDRLTKGTQARIRRLDTSRQARLVRSHSSQNRPLSNTRIAIALFWKVNRLMKENSALMQLHMVIRQAQREDCENQVQTALALRDNAMRRYARREAGEDIQQEVECDICMESLANTILVPCGHGDFCWDCAQRVHSCPLCRQSIRSRYREEE